MKRIVIAIIAASFLAHAATEDDQVAARADALDLAGAWSNDGFKIRDGYWTGVTTPTAPKLVQVNLFAGNHYWFSVAAHARAKGVSVAVFDESGKPVAVEPYADGVRAAARFSPLVSGPYFIQVTTKEGPPSAFCLVYSYK
jgi:hypothetical protein